MRSLALNTTNPFDIVPRVLDHARKAEFVLLELRVSRTGDASFAVRLAFAAAPAISFETMVAQVARMVDVGDLVELPWDAESGGDPAPMSAA